MKLKWSYKKGIWQSLGNDFNYDLYNFHYKNIDKDFDKKYLLTITDKIGCVKNVRYLD